MKRALSVASLACALAVGAGARPARAEATPSAEQRPPEPVRSPGRSVGLGIAGALTAFLAHEAGHVFANLLLGNSPRFEGLMVWGFVPFFVVKPGISCDGDACVDRAGDRFRAGRRGNYFIVSAGFHVQHALDEVLLARAPDLRRRSAPFQKGMLLFNLGLSCMYAAGALTGLEDPHGDLANASRLSRIEEAWLASLLLVPVAVDAYRYFVPGARWAPWVSRGAKASVLGITFAF